MGDLGAALRSTAEQRALQDVQLLETHISWVLLADEFAWKIKKPVQLEFADFSTLERREYFCHEELRLNRRLAPQMYLGVVPITGTTGEPVLEGQGRAIDYAVKMRRFPQQQLLSHVLERGELLAAHVDDLAATLADFQQQIAVAGEESRFGTPASIERPVRENFAYFREHLHEPSLRKAIQSLEAQTTAHWPTIAGLSEARRHQGFVREGHGDMHLGNMVLLKNRVTVFDAIDFNPDLRWIDVINEAAFVVMDLHRRGRSDLAFRFLNRYCELTGDYGGVRLLPFYVAYRALVRAKVRLIRSEQHGGGPSPADEDLAPLSRLVQVAAEFTQPGPPLLLITCGLSGCGKTTFSQALLERIGAIRIRSDVERKRLAAGGELSDELYSSAATEQTYARLADLAGPLLESGLPVLVDATFLQQRDRDRFAALARKHQARFAIAALEAPAAVLRTRIEARRRAGGDASDADVGVLEKQIANHQWPTLQSDPAMILLDATREPETLAQILCERLALHPT